MTAPCRDCVVVHPGVQHSGDLARALFECGRLNRLMTRVQFGESPGRIWSSPALKSLLSRRQVVGLPDEMIMRIQPYSEVAQRVSARWLGAEALARRAQGSTRAFEEAAARLLPGEAAFAVGTDWGADRLFRLLRAARPDVIRVLDISHPAFSVCQRLLMEDASSLSLPIETYDDYVPTDLVGAALELQASEFRSANSCIVASSFSAASVLDSTAGALSPAVIPYGVDASMEPPRRSWSGTGRLLFVGALSERKGLSLLLAAMRKLESAGDLHLDLVGAEAGDYRLPTHLPSNVTHHPRLASGRLSALMRSAHLLILPSMCEGFGRVILEGLACGAAVLTTERSGAPDIVAKDSEAPVHLLQVKERAHLADAIRTALSTEADAGDTAGRAWRAAKAFSMATYSSRLAAALVPGAGGGPGLDG